MSCSTPIARIEHDVAARRTVQDSVGAPVRRQRPVRGPDVKISKNGSMLLVEPISSRARQWLICNPRIERWPWRGSALMVEALVAPDLISAMVDYGLRIFRYGVPASGTAVIVTERPFVPGGRLPRAELARRG
jgi:hypothetical protein